jgi:hypothetical protein
MGRALAHVNQPFDPRKQVQKINKREFNYYTYSATIYDDIGIGYARAAAADGSARDTRTTLMRSCQFEPSAQGHLQ